MRKGTRLFFQILGTVLAAYSSSLYVVNALGNIGSTPYNKVGIFDCILFVVSFLLLLELANIWINNPTFNAITNVVSLSIIPLAVFIKFKFFPARMLDITMSTIVLSVLIWTLNFKLKKQASSEL